MCTWHRTPKLNDLLQYISPVITEIVNRSLLSRLLLQESKSAVIKPLLKKRGLPLELKNCRRGSNLSFLSKVLEKAALNQIVDNIEANNLPSEQKYGVESAMIKMHSDLLKAIEKVKLLSL